MSLPLWMRIAFTVPVVAIEFVLIRSLVRTAQLDDPRPAALLLFMIGVIAAITVPVLREVWRSTVEWKQDRAGEADDRRALDDRLRLREPLTQFQNYRAEPRNE